jgi:phosphatidylglycerol---prolipoprotein diacylglyceryl transferase
MYPILFESGSIILPAWHVMYVLGAVLGFLFLLRLGKKYYPEIHSKSLGNLFAVVYISGYFGARLMSIFVDQPELSGLDAFVALFRFGPMTFYGGGIGAVLGGYSYARFSRLQFKRLLDIGLPSGLIALGIGRVGCFLNGDDYGKVVSESSWWTVSFPVLGDNLPRYPVQLISAALAIGGALILVHFFERIRSSLGPGAVGLIGVLAYGLVRYFIEYFRGDPRGSVFSGMFSTSQFVSILLVLGVSAYCIGKKIKGHSH